MVANRAKKIGVRFGTDGIRGVANSELSPEVALLVGKCAAHHLCRETRPGARGRVLVGKDTRISGDMMEAALIAGILSTGAEAWRVGVAPTPTLAWLTKTLNCDCGVMISASHNPVEDNGLKLFSGEGFKLEEKEETAIEKLMDEDGGNCRVAAGDRVGCSIDKVSMTGTYVDFIKSFLKDVHFDKPLVIDCAYGAASRFAKRIFKSVADDVVFLHGDEDGKKINVDCGSTRPERLQEEIVKRGAFMGFAFDGDGDRVIFADEKGNVVDGDQAMLLCARDFIKNDRLADNTVVTTVMSNMGLEDAINKIGGKMIRTAVGDKYVLREMLKSNYALGGEQSGHVIFLDRATTGDGLLTAAEALRICSKSKAPFSEQTHLKRSSQYLKNVRVPDKDAFYENKRIQEKVKEVEKRLADDGRVVVRPSGTEPLIRVMVEAWDQKVAESSTDEIIELVKEEFETE